MGYLAVFSLLFFMTVANAQLTCEDEQIPCDDGSACIYGLWKCDGEKNCADGGDEKDCDCADDLKCDEGTVCIFSSWKCDGNEDCKDGSDEQNCDRNYDLGAYARRKLELQESLKKEAMEKAREYDELQAKAKKEALSTLMELLLKLESK